MPSADRTVCCDRGCNPQSVSQASGVSEGGADSRQGIDGFLILLLNVPLRTVYVWNHSRTGPAVTKVGKHVRYSRKAVDEWLVSRTEQPVAS
jgi:excisionase family DNA binding protein